MTSKLLLTKFFLQRKASIVVVSDRKAALIIAGKTLGQRIFMSHERTRSLGRVGLGRALVIDQVSLGSRERGKWTCLVANRNACFRLTMKIHMERQMAS